MTMGENPAYRLRGVEVKEVSHRPPNPIKHNPAEISTAPIMKNTCDVDYHGIEEASTSIMSLLSPLGQNLYECPGSPKGFVDQLKTRFHVQAMTQPLHCSSFGGMLLVSEPGIAVGNHKEQPDPI